MAYTKVATISTDTHHSSQEFRASTGAQWPFLSDPERTVQKDLEIQEYTDPEHDPMIPHTLVLKPGLVIHSVYNGYWFWGRPSFVDLWHDLRTVTREIRPDWDLSKPGLREAWDAGDYSPFHGWNKRSPESMPTSYHAVRPGGCQPGRAYADRVAPFPPRSHAEVARILRHAGYSEEFINEVLSQLPDPIELERDQPILDRYGLSPERLMEQMGGSP